MMNWTVDRRKGKLSHHTEDGFVMLLVPSWLVKASVWPQTGHLSPWLSKSSQSW